MNAFSNALLPIHFLYLSTKFQPYTISFLQIIFSLSHIVTLQACTLGPASYLTVVFPMLKLLPGTVHFLKVTFLIFVIMTSGTTFPTSARPLSGFLRVMRWSPPIITIIITSLAPCTGEPLLHLVKVEKARCHSVKFSVFCPLK